MADIFTGKWYPWYAAKALESEDFADLSLTEEGAYRRALDIAWKKGSLPSDPCKFAAVVGKRCTERQAAKVLKLFMLMPGHPSRVINGTLERIRKEQEEKHRRRVGAGKQGGRPKIPTNENGGEESIDKAMPNQCLSNAPTDLDIDKEVRDKEEEKREKKVAAAPRRKQTQDEWLDSLRSDSLYSHVNFNRELDKAQKWIRNNPGRQFTKNFFIHWINKIEPPLVVSPAAQVGQFNGTSTYVPEPPCEYCGEEFCNKTHREERGI